MYIYIDIHIQIFPYQEYNFFSTTIGVAWHICEVRKTLCVDLEIKKGNLDVGKMTIKESQYRIRGYFGLGKGMKHFGSVRYQCIISRLPLLKCIYIYVYLSINKFKSIYIICLNIYVYMYIIW